MQKFSAIGLCLALSACVIPYTSSSRTLFDTVSYGVVRYEVFQIVTKEYLLTESYLPTANDEPTSTSIEYVVSISGVDYPCEDANSCQKVLNEELNRRPTKLPRKISTPPEIEGDGDGGDADGGDTGGGMGY